MLWFGMEVVTPFIHNHHHHDQVCFMCRVSTTLPPSTANGTPSHRSLSLPRHFRRARPTDLRPLRRRQPQPQGDRSTAHQGPAMHRPRQRSLHRYDGEVLLSSSGLQASPWETPVALPGTFQHGSLCFPLKFTPFIQFDTHLPWSASGVWWSWQSLILFISVMSFISFLEQNLVSIIQITIDLLLNVFFYFFYSQMLC